MTKKANRKQPVDDTDSADTAKAATGQQTPSGTERSPSDAEGSVSGRSGAAFRPPRRTSDAGSVATALEDRFNATRVRSAAEMLEKDAETSASKASKKARTAAVTGAGACGKRAGKGKPGEADSLDLSDFPSGDC